METTLRLAVIAAGLGAMVGALWSERTCWSADGSAPHLAGLGATVALAVGFLL